MSYEIPFDSISNCPLRASDIGAGGVGKAAADNFQGRLRYILTRFGSLPTGARVYIYTYPVPVSYTGELKIKAPMPGASSPRRWGLSWE